MEKIKKYFQIILWSIIGILILAITFNFLGWIVAEINYLRWGIIS